MGRESRSAALDAEAQTEPPAQAKGSGSAEAHHQGIAESIEDIEDIEDVEDQDELLNSSQNGYNLHGIPSKENFASVQRKNSSPNITYNIPYSVQSNIRESNDLSPNVSGVVKKKSKKIKEHFTTDMITNEFNQNNLLVFIVIYLATIPLTDEYTRKLLSMLNIYVNTSSSIFIK